MLIVELTWQRTPISQPPCQLSFVHPSMVSLNKPFSPVIPAYWRLHRPDSMILVSMVVPPFYTLRSCPLLFIVQFSRPMISPMSAFMPMMTCSGAMPHGHTSGRNQSGSFRFTVHYQDIGSSAPLISPLESSYFLTALLNRSLGRMKSRSVNFAS